MKITEIRIHPVKAAGNLKAYAVIVLNDALVIEDFRIIETSRGLVVAMPSKKTACGNYRDMVYPITSEINDMLQKSVVRAYEDEMSRPHNANHDN